MNAQPTRQTSRVAGVLASLLLVAGNSQAAPLACTGQTFTPAMTVDDMTFGSSASAATAADACVWSTAKPPHTEKAINAQWQNWLDGKPEGTAGLPFVELAKWDVPDSSSSQGGLTSNVVFGFRWTLALSFTSPGLKAGTYTLTATAITSTPPSEVTLPHIFDFVGVLKGGSGAGSWFFDDRLFNSPGGGTWRINFRNNGNQIPDLSNLTIFARSVGSPPPPPPNGVPTPGTLSLVGLALLAGWVAAARRQRIARA